VERVCAVATVSATPAAATSADATLPSGVVAFFAAWINELDRCLGRPPFPTPTSFEFRAALRAIELAADAFVASLQDQPTVMGALLHSGSMPSNVAPSTLTPLQVDAAGRSLMCVLDAYVSPSSSLCALLRAHKDVATTLPIVCSALIRGTAAEHNDRQVEGHTLRSMAAVLAHFAPALRHPVQDVWDAIARADPVTTGASSEAVRFYLATGRAGQRALIERLLVGVTLPPPPAFVSSVGSSNTAVGKKGPPGKPTAGKAAPPAPPASANGGKSKAPAAPAPTPVAAASKKESKSNAAQDLPAANGRGEIVGSESTTGSGNTGVGLWLAACTCAVASAASNPQRGCVAFRGAPAPPPPPLPNIPPLPHHPDYLPVDVCIKVA
jgi:hypothetical protein